MRVILSTLNASYHHSSLALRYLKANVGDEFASSTSIREFIIGQRPVDIVEELLAEEPDVIGFGIYVWNTRETLDVIALLKKLAPHAVIVVGGPEVSHESNEQAICHLADYVVVGEGEAAFSELLAKINSGRKVLTKVLPVTLPELDTLNSPYALYTEEDIANRSIYVEASRGCPYRCQFCLSSLDKKVRQFPLDNFLADMEMLLAKGATHFKFIDRTFNLNLKTTTAILEFFYSRLFPGLFLHFEMVPDRFPEELRDLVSSFPAGSLQFEVGIQTFDDEVAARIDRRHDASKIDDNLTWLRRHTNVHIHSDLIVGLPGESVSQFANGFDRLVALDPHEIQVGILKRLRGAPIAMHTEEFGIVYSDTAPYEVLCTDAVTFTEMQEMKFFARAWDLVCNSGNFVVSAPLLWGELSPFAEFMAFTRWLRSERKYFYRISLRALTEKLFEYLTKHLELPRSVVGEALAKDYGIVGRAIPNFLSDYAPSSAQAIRTDIPRRQALHSRR